MTEYVRDNETALLFNHSSRAYRFAAISSERSGLRFDPELLYAGAMFTIWATCLRSVAGMIVSKWMGRTRLVLF